MGGVDLLFLDMIKIIVLGLLSIAVADPVAEAEAYRGYRGYGGYGYRGGYGGYRGFYRGKREAEPLPEAEASADPYGGRYYGGYRGGYGGYRGGYGGYRGGYRG